MTSIYIPQSDATSVDYCTAANFVQAGQENLILARRNVLQIFRVLKTPLKRANESPDENKLVLFAQYSLFGTIRGLSAIKSGTNSLDHVLVIFETAKASLLKWDTDAHTLHTTSLHCFERDEYATPLHSPIEPKYRADPAHRVSTIQISESHLAFLPVAVKDELMMDEVNDIESYGIITSSFVLRATQLEEDITQLIDFTYLEGYREPTMAILYAAQGSNTELQAFRKDVCRCVVLTLDLQMGARTAIFELDELPSTLQSVFAIPEPVGGCLLLGPDHIIYIDPASRKVALALNKFSAASGSSSLKARDYSSLNLRLEGAQAIPLVHDKALDGVLIIMADGACGLLTLNLDGRTVTSLHLKILQDSLGAPSIPSSTSCHIQLKDGQLFIGSKSGDSALVSWKKTLRKTTSDDEVKEEDVEMASRPTTANNDDLDDLYGDASATRISLGSETTVFDLQFQRLDSIRHSGPVTGMTTGSRLYVSAKDNQNVADQVAVDKGEIVTVGGAGRAGNLTIHKRSASTEVLGKFDSPAWNSLWTIKLNNSASKQTEPSYDNYFMASTSRETQIFTVETSFVERTDTEFESQDVTILIDTLLDHTCVVQVCPELIRTYDSNLKVLELIQCKAETQIVAASVHNPYVLTISSDGQAALYRMQRRSRELKRMKWDMTEKITAGTLLRPLPTTNNSNEQESRASTKRNLDGEAVQNITKIDCSCALMTREGQLIILQVPSLKVNFKAQAVALPDLLINETAESTSVPILKAMEITSIRFVILGQSHRTPYLILLTSKGDIGLYELFVQISGDSAFRRQPLNYSSRLLETELSDQPMPIVSRISVSSDVDGCACMFVQGSQSFWLIKTDHGPPNLHPANLDGVLALSGFNTIDAPDSFIYCDENNVTRITRHVAGFDYTSQWSCKVIPLHKTVHAVSLVQTHGLYAVLTSVPNRYEIPDEEDETWEPRQNDRELLPEVSRGALELVDVDAGRVLDTVEYAANEQALCVQSVVLTVATEYTKKKRSCLAVSTAIYRGEDLAMRGAVYVYDVVEVVPDEINPDSKYRLRLICREEVRAAATALCEVDGYLLSSQGQKVVIRSLEEDERLSPVAFVDLGLTTTTAKSLKAFLLFGDINNGIRFAGFGEEPYKVTHFGRDYDGMDVLDAEFIINGKSLLFVASDPTGNIRLLQYDPENSTTLAGQKLIRRADMQTGHIISSMRLIADPDKVDGEKLRTGVLCAAADGSFGLLIPITERSYRRLFTVQAQLSSSRVQMAGLNPRAYRTCTLDIPNGNAARGMLDGQLLSQFLNLSFEEQTKLTSNTGMGVDHVIQDMTKIQHFMSDY